MNYLLRLVYNILYLDLGVDIYFASKAGFFFNINRNCNLTLILSREAKMRTLDYYQILYNERIIYLTRVS